MNKKVLLISNPGESNSENYCAGVNVDIRNYTDFLTGPSGGAWFSSEIKHLDRPTASQLRSELALHKYHDYILTIFSGHGYYSTARKETILELKNGEEIAQSNLIINSKQTILLDCCRVRVVEPTTETRAFAMAKGAKYLDPAQCRRIYEEQIRECPNGLVVMYGCNIGETSGDSSSRGGYYSSSLLDYAKEFADTSDPQYYLSVVGAHNEAVKLVYRRSGGKQNPQIDKPRTSPYFPFAVTN